MAVKIREKKGCLYLDIIQNRRHNWEALHIKLSTDQMARKEQMQYAEICRATRELQLARGEWNLTDKLAGKKTLIQYFEEIATKKGYDRKHKVPRTIPHLKKYKDGGNIQLVAVNDNWVQDFQNWLLEQSIGQTTAHHYSTALRQVLNEAVKSRILTTSPATYVKNIQLPEIDLPTLTAEEIRLLASTPISGKLGHEMKRAFLFACMTGLRIGELAGRERTKGEGALQWKHIDTKEITEYNKCTHWIKKQQNKTSRFVEIPLNNTAWQLIQPRHFPDTYVFAELALSGTHTDKYLKAWAKSAGLEKTIGMHTARRTFATLLQETGVDIYTVKRLTGHKIEDVTGLYAKSKKLLPEAILQLDKVLDGTEYIKSVAGGAV